MLTDLFGEEVPPRRADIRLAWRHDELLVRATIRDEAVTRRPELPADHPDFWRQDHLELRFLPDPNRDLRSVQCLLTAGGRHLLAGAEGTLTCHAEGTADGWRLEATVPLALAGLAVPAIGQIVRAAVAHVRWGRGTMEAACFSATQLGFSQSERFGELLLDGSPPPVSIARIELAERLSREQAATIHLTAPAGEPLSIVADDGWRQELPGGASRYATTLPLQRPRYQRFALHLGDRELARITLRAAVPELSVDTAALRHPYLHLGPDDLPRCRAKPYVRRLLADHAAPPLPAPDEPPPSFAFTRGCGSWFRVATETMLRDGKGNRQPAAAHLWRLLPPSAQAAFERLRDEVTGSDETYDALLAGMNHLLDRRDLYEPTACAACKLPAASREALAQADRLNPRELRRHNRTLIQSIVECINELGMELLKRALALAQHWLLSGSPEHLAAAGDLLDQAAKTMITELHLHLHTGHAAGQLAALYDAAHPHLSETQRASWLAVARRLLTLYLESIADYGWTVTCVPNANAVGNGGAGRLALATLAELPDLARPVLYHTRRQVETFLDYCHGDDGANTEGVQYWEYGLSNFVLFAHALERLRGEPLEWFQRPALRQAMAMIRLSLCPDGGCHGQNDTIPVAVGGTLAWFFASRYDDPFALWYGDHCHRWHAARDAAGAPTPYAAGPFWALLFRPDLPEQQACPEPLPTAIHLPSIEYAAVRSADRFDCRWMAGIKGARPPYTHHHQSDVGSCFVHVGGERLLIDPGYYKPEATDHCLPLIGERGPDRPRGWAGRVTACRAWGDRRYLTCDATRAYNGRAQRVIRHLLMVGEHGIVILDDIHAAAPVTSQWQAGGPTSLAQPRELRIEGQRLSLRLQLDAPGNAAWSLHPERDLHDTHWGYHFADCRLFPVTATYHPAPDCPALIIISESTAAPWRLERQAAAAVLHPPTGEPVRFRHHRQIWSLEC